MDIIQYIPTLGVFERPVDNSKKHRNKRAKVASIARSLVRRAMVKGILPFPSSLKCADCGVRASCYDHRDYSKPLEVVAVCRRCNAARGPALG